MSSAKLSRSLTTKDLTIYGMLFMIPVAPMAWYGTFLAPAAGMVALAYLIGMVAMLFTGFSYFTMSARYPISGSVYSYVQKGANSNLGFLAGWAIMLDYILVPAVAYLVGALFIAKLTPGVPAAVWIIIFAIFTTVINVLGVKLMARISWILFALQLFVVFYFIIGVIVLMSFGELQFETISFYNPEAFNMDSLLGATAVAVVSFLGFDAISTLSEESKDPKRSVGKATVWSLLLIGTLFVVVSFFAGVAHPNYGNLDTATAFLVIAEEVGGTFLRDATIIIIFLSFGLACALESHAGVARMLFSMGRDGILPKPLAHIHPKFKTPHVALYFIGALSLVVGIVLSLASIASLLSFGALLGFISLNLAVIWHFFVKNDRKDGVTFVKYLVSPFLGFLVCAWIFSGLSNQALIVGGIWMAVGFLYLIFATKGFSKQAPEMELEEDEGFGA